MKPKMFILYNGLILPIEFQTKQTFLFLHLYYIFLFVMSCREVFQLFVKISPSRKSIRLFLVPETSAKLHKFQAPKSIAFSGLKLKIGISHAESLTHTFAYFSNIFHTINILKMLKCHLNTPRRDDYK